MNIFEIFFSGKRRLNEENMSSALQFLLDPGASHGYGISALTEFLAPVGPQIVAACTAGRAASARNASLRSVMASFKHFALDLEETVFKPENMQGQNLRMIDLTIQCLNDKKEPGLVIAIENKILSNSAPDKRQLAEEYAFLRARLDKDVDAQAPTSKRIPIVFIYLTPEELSGDTLAQWSELPLPESPTNAGVDFKAHYTWKPRTAGPASAGSVTAIARSLLHKEQDGHISPASSHAALFLRSMLKFIDSDFAPERRGEPLQDAPDNAQEILTEEEFWAAWQEAKPKSLTLAQDLHARILQATVAAGRPLADHDGVFSLTRAGYFEPNGKRLIALMLQPPTTNGRVALQVKLGMDDNGLQALAQEMQAHGIAVKPSGINVEVQVPVGIDPASLDRLMTVLVGQLP